MVRKKAGADAPEENQDGGEVLPTMDEGQELAAGDGSGEALPPIEQNGDQEQMAGGPADDDGEGAEAAAAGYNAEGDHISAIDRMGILADELEFGDSSGLVQEVRDFLIETIKARPKPWSATSQAEQRDVVAACEYQAKELVRKAVEAVASQGVNPVRILLTKVNMGSDIVITGKLKAMDPEEEARDVMVLHRGLNKHAMLTIASAEDYSNGGEAPTDPDEQSFGFEGE